MTVFLLSGTVLALLRISVLFYTSQVLHNHSMGSPLSFLSYLLLPEALLLSDVSTYSAFFDSVLLAVFLIVGSFLITSPLLILGTRKIK
jgi:hypothetical protein